MNKLRKLQSQVFVTVPQTKIRHEFSKHTCKTTLLARPGKPTYGLNNEELVEYYRNKL